MDEKSFNIAVVGAGVAGIVASYILQRKHRVTLFEKNDYLGGHTNTIPIPAGPDEGAPVDTGFIVLNEKTYPLLHRFLKQLNVPVRNSDMSFGFHCERTGLQYAGRGLKGLFAQRSNLLNPSFLKLVYELFRFGKIAKTDLTRHVGILKQLNLGEYVMINRFSPYFVDNYLLPMGAAIWSAPSSQMLLFPAETFVRFFNNHGLLTIKDIPTWQTVVGGSFSYVKEFVKMFRGQIRFNSKIQQIQRENDAVIIQSADGTNHQFDKVVLACHADESLGLLSKPTEDESRLLGTWKYNINHTILHTDDAVMPPNPNAWASWNYTRESTETQEDRLSVTYHMNRLQGLNTKRQYYVTLNRAQKIRDSEIIREFYYTHPVYSFDAVKNQHELPSLNGQRNTYFCGSYFGYGFHEDAVRSGVEVARHFGLEL